MKDEATADSPQPKIKIEPEGVSDGEALGLILMMLFGPDGGKGVEEGGYITWSSGRSKGILQQIDERLCRLEKSHGLDDLSFVVGEQNADLDVEITIARTGEAAEDSGKNEP